MGKLIKEWVKGILTENIEKTDNLEIVSVKCDNNLIIPMIASRNCIEENQDYDILGYMEDDILIEDSDFFGKIKYLTNELNRNI